MTEAINMKSGNRILPVIVLLIASTGIRADQERVDRRVDVLPDGFVHINVVRGEVDIKAWDRAQVEVTGVLDEETREFIFETEGNETRIEVKLPTLKGGWFHRNGSDLDIRVPAGSQLSVTGVSTDVTAKGMGAAVEIGVISGDVSLTGGRDRIVLHTVSGDLDVREAKGRMRIKSVSGDIESYGSTGKGEYSTVSGSILVEEGDQELKLESVSGDIEVLDTDFSSISGDTVSGDVEIRGVMAHDGLLEVGNVSGSIRVKLQGNVDARFEIEAGSGSIRNRLSDDKPRTGKYVRDKTLRFVVGEGSGEVFLSTRSGDIILSD